MAAERSGPDPTRARGALQIQVSKLLLASTVAAIATSFAMIVTAVVIGQGPPSPPGPGGQPPPPPVGPIVLMVVITGLFVVSWLAVIAVLARDQVLRRMRGLAGGDEALAETQELLAELRRELAEDRRSDLATLETRLAEYGEQRETDGYVNGMRMAVRSDQPPAGVRPLHRVPPTP